MKGLIKEEEDFLTNPENITSNEGIERLGRLRLLHIKAIIAKSAASKEAIENLAKSGKCNLFLETKLISALKL